MYKYEIHLHSCVCSHCAKSDATEYVKTAKDMGYAGMVFTNHFIRSNTNIDRKLPWREFVYKYRDDYLRARELGESLDVDVLFGIEEGFEYGKEALIYGISPELLADAPEFAQMTPEQISAFVRGNGGFIVRAHPFRKRPYANVQEVEMNPDLVDAVEVYNLANDKEDNRKAEEYAKKHCLPGLSGGDVHNVCDFGKAGIILPKRAKNESELVSFLKKGEYRLIADKGNGNLGDLFEYSL